MNASDGKAKSVTANTVTKSSSKSNENTGRSGLIILLFIGGLITSMILGWMIFPKLLYSKKKQPFNFNHSLHVEEVSEGCEGCHYFHKDGSFSGIPENKQCIECHYEMIGESDAEAIFVREFLDKNKEVPWFIYSKQPDCVFFSHAAHTKGSEKIDCTVCHGHIGESEVSKPYEYNKITGYSRNIWGKNMIGLKVNSWDRMKMDDCAECHNKSDSSHNSSVQTERDACFVCHK